MLQTLVAEVYGPDYQRQLQVARQIRSVFETLTLFNRDQDLLWLKRQVRSLPSVKAAEQRCCVGNSIRFQKKRRTGAGLFGRSSTVRNDFLVLRQSGNARRKHGLGQRKSAFDVCGLIGELLPHVDNDCLASLHQ